jgi:metal-sulfur cluster biosynthetic enzyme
MMVVSRAAVLDALRQVPEPCSIIMRAPTDICEMGLVEDVRIEGSAVRVELVLTDPSCAHFSSMRRYIEDAISKVEAVETVAVVLSTSKLWTPDRRGVT